MPKNEERRESRRAMSERVTEAERERLELLIEELGESIQAATKVLRFGYESRHPKRPEGETNRESLERELGDVRAAIVIMLGAADINDGRMKRCAKKKAIVVRSFLIHQEPW